MRGITENVDARPENAKKQKNGDDLLMFRTEAAEAAGLSERQRKTAVNVANISAEEFEAAVESDNPPTVTALAENGKKSRPLVDRSRRKRP